jgi:arsenate reductase (glutaredoxin)
MPITIYGIKNCDTMKRARAWLDKHGVDYAFHDYKTAGIERARLEEWAKQVGWEALLNRAGTTFRKLPDKDKNNVDAKKAIALMLRPPSMIKRPVLDLGFTSRACHSPADQLSGNSRLRRACPD